MQLQQLIEQTPEQIQLYVQQHEQQVVEAMLQQIGATDAFTRETVNFQLFSYLINEQLFQTASYNEIANFFISNRTLLQDIQVANSDAVFTRSSTALWLTLLLKEEQKTRRLDDATFEAIQLQAIESLQREKDARGYIDAERGWADAVGVIAELCYVVLQDERFDITKTSQMLQAISASLWNEHVFTNNEDERFIKILMAFVHKGVDEALLIEWVEQVFDRLEYYGYEAGYTQQWFTARTNILQLMKTLYFHLKFSHQYDQLRATASIFIQKWLKLS